MDYVAVSSSTVGAVGFDEASSTLGVRFNTGAEYHYSGVPRQVFDGLVSASSVGQYLDQFVKKAGYPYTRVA